MNVLSNKTFQSKCDVLKNIRKHVREICISNIVDKTNIENIVLAVNEACMNIIQHAYKNEPDNEFSVLIALSDTEDSKEIIIQLIDHAEKIDPAKIKSRDLEDVKPGGIGVHFIHELMDSANYIKDDSFNGNILELRKKI